MHQSTSSNNVKSVHDTALKYFKAGKFEAAEAELKKLLSRYPVHIVGIAREDDLGAPDLTGPSSEKGKKTNRKTLSNGGQQIVSRRSSSSR